MNKINSLQAKQMAAFPDPHWSNISRLSQKLSVLEENMNSHKEIAKQKANEAFKAIKKELKHPELIDVETLQRTRDVLVSYLETLPAEDSKATNIFSKTFRSTPRQKIEKIQANIDKTIDKAASRREKLVEKKLKEWKKLSGDELRQNMRSFIMRACQGEMKMSPCSIQLLFLSIESQLSETDANIREILNDPLLFSSYELKTGTCSKDDPPNISDCIATKLKNKEKTIQVTDQAANDEIQKMENERAFRLRNLERVYERVSRDPSQSVAGKYYEKTSAWYIGSFIGKSRETPCESEMQQIGAKHGITCITDSDEESLKEQDNIMILNDKQGAPFPQDFVDFSLNEVRIPIMHMERYPEINNTFLEHFFRKKREVRNPDWSKKQGLYIGEEKVDNPRVRVMASIGYGFLDDLGKKSVKLALGLGATPIMNLTYNEGGNTLIGSRQEGTFVIIGQDSYDFSKYLMEKELNREMSHEEITMAFAIDYGVKKENVFFVEQPGDFHLDMNLAIIGENTIAVNDAVLAKEIFDEEQNEFLSRSIPTINDQLKQTANKQRAIRAAGKKIFEDKTAEDLKAHHFNVERVAGCFDYQLPRVAAPSPLMNFFNMITATAPNGEKIVVAMGVINEKYKEKFREMLQLGGENVEVFYFLDLVESAYCLRSHGGISCRSKTIPATQKEDVNL